MNIGGIFHKRNTIKAVSQGTRDNIYELNEVSRDEDSDPFLNSLKNLTPDDIAPKPPKKRRPVSDIITDLIRYAIFAVCAVVFMWSVFTIIRSFIDYNKSGDLYGSIADNIFSADFGQGEHAVSLSIQSRQNSPLSDYYSGLALETDDISGLEKDTYNVKFEQMKANLTYLKSINPDIFGYIYIDGTNISFPIVQSDDNEYYLTHAYTGEYMIVGSIFADFRAYKDMDLNRNTVFYGHNIMFEGNMFNNVTKFLDESVFDSTMIEIYTFDGIYTYEPFAIFETISTFQYFRMSFTDDDDFISFCDEMQSKSLYNKNMTFTGNDSIITLSTCTNAATYNGRYALHAKLVKVER